MFLHKRKILGFVFGASLLASLGSSVAIPSVNSGDISIGTPITATFTQIGTSDSPLFRQTSVLLKFSQPILGIKRQSILIKNGRLVDFAARRDSALGNAIKEVRFKVVPTFSRSESSVNVSVSLDTKELYAVLEGLPVATPSPLLLSFAKRRLNHPLPTPTATSTPKVTVTPQTTKTPTATPSTTVTPSPTLPINPNAAITVSPAHPILVVGSSTIAGWDYFKTDFSQFPVTREAGSGAKLRGFVREINSVVQTKKPGLLMVYAGTNDLAERGSPEEVLQTFKQFVENARAASSDLPIVWIYIFPSVTGQRTLTNIRATNALIEQYAKTASRIYTIDTYTPMSDAQGNPIMELLGPDKRHMSRAGYLLWVDLFKAFFAQKVKVAMP